MADVHLRLVSRTFSSELNLRGNVWAVKYPKSSKPDQVYMCLVPRDQQDSPKNFEDCVDRQTGQDSGFRIR